MCGYLEGGYVLVAMLADQWIDLAYMLCMLVQVVLPLTLKHRSLRWFTILIIGISTRSTPIFGARWEFVSSTYPDISLYQKQDLLNPTPMLAIKSILFNSTEPLNSGVLNQIYQAVPPDDPLSIVIPEVNMVQTYIADGTKSLHPCRSTAVEGVTDLLCQVFIDNSLVKAVLNARYHIQFCHSPDDKVVTIDNIPANISQYSHLSFIEASGEHQEAGTFCLVQAILYLRGMIWSVLTPPQSRAFLRTISLATTATPLQPCLVDLPIVLFCRRLTTHWIMTSARDLQRFPQ